MEHRAFAVMIGWGKQEKKKSLKKKPCGTVYHADQEGCFLILHPSGLFLFIFSDMT
jgi:hypothetical protein